MKPKPHLIVRVEKPKNRICLGKIAKGISSYRIVRGTDGTLWLYSMVEVPLSAVKNTPLTTSSPV